MFSQWWVIWVTEGINSQCWVSISDITGQSLSSLIACINILTSQGTHLWSDTFLKHVNASWRLFTAVTVTEKKKKKKKRKAHVNFTCNVQKKRFERFHWRIWRLCVLNWACERRRREERKKKKHETQNTIFSVTSLMRVNVFCKNTFHYCPSPRVFFQQKCLQ